MKFCEMIKQYYLLIFIIFIIIITTTKLIKFCLIIRKRTEPLLLNPLLGLNGHLFFGDGEFQVSLLSLFSDYAGTELDEKYAEARLIIEIKNDNQILFHVTFLHKFNNYSDLPFYLIWNINESNLKFEDGNIENNGNSNITIKFKDKNKDLSPTLRSFYCPKDKSTLYFHLSFKKYYCIFEFRNDYRNSNYIITVFIGIYLLFSKIWKNNFQSVFNLFFYVIWAKINGAYFHLFQLYQNGLIYLKYTIFHIGLLLHGKFILSIFDIFIIFIFITKIIASVIAFFAIFLFEKNYNYCFNNKIKDQKIVLKETKISKNYLIIFCILVYVNYPFKTSFNHYFPLILIIILTIFKHLNQREVMYEKDNKFCIKFYSIGIEIYSFYLFRVDILFFLKECPFFPFIIILFLHIILYIVVKYEYKFKYVMEKDLERLKKLDKQSCPICLGKFIYDKTKANKYFIRATVNENIHETKCKHYFHERCLFLWRRNKNICPYCVRPLQIPQYYFFL